MALLDILEGTDSRLQPLSESQSIKSHIYRLLNSRKNMICHLPEYGMIDVEAMYENLEYKSVHIADSIRKVIENYEKRLSHVKVTALEHEGKKMDSEKKMKKELGLQNNTELLNKSVGMISGEKSQFNYVIRFQIQGLSSNGERISMQVFFNEYGKSSIEEHTIGSI